MPRVYGVRLIGHEENSWAAIWKLLLSENPDAILWSGDVATAQDPTAYHIANSKLTKLLKLPEKSRKEISGIPVYCVPGNHDHFSVKAKTTFYLRKTSIFRKTIVNPKPTEHVLNVKRKKIVIFSVDSSSGINSADSPKLAIGRIHKEDLKIIDKWMDIAKSGGVVDSIYMTINDLKNACKILLIHHDLSSKKKFHGIKGDGLKKLLKFCANMPIDIVACGHIHSPNTRIYKLFGRGKLDKRQYKNMQRKGILKGESVKISRPGTTCQNGANTHTIHIIEINNDTVDIHQLRYFQGNFIR